MATLTPAQLAAYRRAVVGDTPPTFTKPPLNAAIQEVEGALPACFAVLTGAITGPWTQAQKRKIARVVLTNRVLELLGG
jgi:hypothetical protein